MILEVMKQPATTLATDHQRQIAVLVFFTFMLSLVQPVRLNDIISETNSTAGPAESFDTLATRLNVEANDRSVTNAYQIYHPRIGGPKGFIALSPYEEKEILNVMSFLAITPIKEKVKSNISTTEDPDLQLCGYPIFMDPRNCNSNSSISSCMSNGKAISFGVLITIIGVSIIGLNVLIPVLVIANKGLRTQHYYIKASLAVADSIVGFLLTFAVLPNIIWVTGISVEELVRYPEEDKNSPRAVSVGAFLTVSITASLLHLTYLSFERFTAIKWPFRHMRRKTQSIILMIACLWTISLAASFVPAAFPKYFAYEFQPMLLIHIMTLQSVDGTMSEWRGILYGTITIIIPYIFMSVFCAITALETHRKIKKSRKIIGGQHKNTRSKTPVNQRSNVKTQSIERKDPEISVFITVGMMIATFTLTLMPFTIVLIVFLAGSLNCDNIIIPYVSLFYVGMLNSLANGIIYNVRDKRFRQAVKKIFPCPKSPVKTESVVTQSQVIQSTQH